MPKSKPRKKKSDRRRAADLDMTPSEAAARAAFSASLYRLHAAFLRLYDLRDEKLKQYVRTWLLGIRENPDDIHIPGFVTTLGFGRPNGTLQQELVELTEQFFQTLYSNVGFFMQWERVMPSQRKSGASRPHSVAKWLRRIQEDWPALSDQAGLLEEARAYRAAYIDHPSLGGIQSWYFFASPVGDEFVYVPILFTAQEGHDAPPDAAADVSDQQDGLQSFDPYSPYFRLMVDAKSWIVPPPFERVFYAWIEIVTQICSTDGRSFEPPPKPEQRSWESEGFPATTEHMIFAPLSERNAEAGE